MKVNMEQNILTLVLLTCSCFAAPTNGPDGKEISNGPRSEMSLGIDGEGKALRTNAILPPPGQEEQPTYLVHGEGLFQPPPAGTLKLYMPGMLKVMVPPKVTMADFDFLDQNGNGLIDSTDLAIGSNLPGFADHAFKISDVDNDGFVNPDEFFQFPMSWQRVVAEVRFQEAAHGSLTFNTQLPEETPQSEGKGETTPYDSQHEGNMTIAVVNVGEDPMSANETVLGIAEEGIEAEGEAENEGQLVETTGMPAEKDEGAYVLGRSNGMTNGQTSRGQVDVSESPTDGEIQEVVEQETGKLEPSAGIQDTQVAGATSGEVDTMYSAGQNGRYQSPSAQDLGPSDGGRDEDQDQVGTKQDGVRPFDTQGYYEGQHKASYPAYPVKSMSGYIYAPYIKEARPNAKEYHYSIQSRRTGDSSEEEHGGGSSSDEEEDDRK
ncbi:hypothetical protein CHS0354_026170 [Potamilus streckersoni]|uniref:EF-hand domain-containing protein n=1 Tax=Potamilus streckersoni TaxID=2493646 RepID=A0AAE0SC17_9BIVA|nr:hypothetical protein CHS0354_026170 [Potamilus streckersoni]